MWKKIIAAIVIILIAFAIFIHANISFFTIQPIGAMPKGTTFVMWKKGKMRTFESPDGICLTMTGGVSLMCRSMVIGTTLNKDEVLFKMPYVKYIYLRSTDGKEFDR